MLVPIPDHVAEDVANQLGTNDPVEIGRAVATLWDELGNPEEMIEDVKSLEVAKI